MPNKALHRTAIPLRFIAAGELGRYLKRLKATDPDALLKLSVKLANDLKAAMERLNQNLQVTAPSRQAALAPWEKAGQDDDDDPPADGGA